MTLDQLERGKIAAQKLHEADVLNEAVKKDQLKFVLQGRYFAIPDELMAPIRAYYTEAYRQIKEEFDNV
jgi:hypothetical protein